MKLATPNTITVSHCLRVRRARDPWGRDGPDDTSIELGADSISGCRSSKAILIYSRECVLKSLGDRTVRRFAHARMCSSGAAALAVSTALKILCAMQRGGDGGAPSPVITRSTRESCNLYTRSLYYFMHSRSDVFASDLN
jgi:hypothetical protein